MEFGHCILMMKLIQWNVSYTTALRISGDHLNSPGHYLLHGNSYNTVIIQIIQLSKFYLDSSNEVKVLCGG